MKRILFIPAILLLVMAGSSYSCGEKEKGDEDIKLTPCNHPLEQSGELGLMKVRLFNKYPENMEDMPFMYYVPEENGCTLYKGLSWGKICNFPKDVIDSWKIPDEGLTVVIDGKIFESTSINPAFGVYYDLELTTLKLK